jgi:hypothetical protein
MGRQIAIAATAEDERALLEFLRSTAEIALIETFAPTPEALWIDGFSPELNGHWSYLIWNRSFPWEPVYGEVGPQAHDPTQVGWFYVRNRSTGPLLEFGRSDVPGRRYGRLYWCKSSAAPPDYDVQAFSAWYDAVVKWVRRTGRRREPKEPFSPYFLPDAWETAESS